MKGKRKHLFIVCLLISVLLVGVVMVQGCKKSGPDTSSEEGGQKWYCPDHPYIISDRPVKCRVCGKDLVPLEEKKEEEKEEEEKK